MTTPTVPRISIIEADPALSAVARSYFAAEAAEKAARVAYRASWGTPAEWHAFETIEETVRASQQAWMRLRDAVPGKTLGLFYSTDSRLYGWAMIGPRYAFRVRDAESSRMIRNRLAGGREFHTSPIGGAQANELKLRETYRQKTIRSENTR